MCSHGMFPPLITSLTIFTFWGLEGNRSNTRAFNGSTLAVTKRTGFDHVAFQGHHFCCTWLVQGWSCWGDCGVGSWLLWGPSIPQSGMWWGKGQSRLRRGCWRQLHGKSNGITNTSILEINTHFSFLLGSSQGTWYQSLIWHNYISSLGNKRTMMELQFIKFT